MQRLAVVTRPTRPPIEAEEMRQRILELVRAGRAPASLVKEFEPTGTTMRNWIAQAERDAGVVPEFHPRQVLHPRLAPCIVSRERACERVDRKRARSKPSLEPRR